MLVGHVLIITWGFIMSIVGSPKSGVDKLIATVLFLAGVTLCYIGV